MKFLIIKPSSLGDVLHAFPAVNALCRAFPGSSADWVIHPAFRELLEYMPCVDRAILFHRKQMGSPFGFFREFLPFARELRQRKYDAVIDLQGLLRSAVFNLLARGSVHAGPAHSSEAAARLCYGKKMKFPDTVRHALEKNNAMVQSLFPDARFDFSFRLPENPVRRAEFLRIPAVCAVPETHDFIHAPWIGVSPGARWQSKRWDPEFFVSVMREICSRRPGARFFLFGSKAESPIAQKILAGSEGISVVNLCGETSIAQLTEGIRMMDLFLSNDSGPMHIAAAAGVPVAAFFGPTDPALTGPCTEKKLIFEPHLPCIHCFKRYCEECRCHSLPDPQHVAEESLDLMM